MTTTGIVHVRIVLKNTRKFVPFAILSRGNNRFSLLFKVLQANNLLFQLSDGL